MTPGYHCVDGRLSHNKLQDSIILKGVNIFILILKDLSSQAVFPSSHLNLTRTGCFANAGGSSVNAHPQIIHGIFGISGCILIVRCSKFIFQIIAGHKGGIGQGECFNLTSVFLLTLQININRIFNILLMRIDSLLRICYKVIAQQLRFRIGYFRSVRIVQDQDWLFCKSTVIFSLIMWFSRFQKLSANADSLCEERWYQSIRFCILALINFFLI